MTTREDIVPTERPSLFWEGGVTFNPEEVVLEGSYKDELSAYRARRVWRDVLEANFLLEAKHDFSLSIFKDEDEESFKLKCDFSTACGRYAFWRLTHNQAPETQYLIETAHIPPCVENQLSMITATDLTIKNGHPAVSDTTLEGLYTPWRLSSLKRWFLSLLR